MMTTISVSTERHSSPTAKDIPFLQFLTVVLEQGTLPEPVPDMGRWTEEYEALYESFQRDGLSGFHTYLSVLSTKHPSLPLWLATPQEKANGRTRKGKQEKEVFIEFTEEEVDTFPSVRWLISKILQESTVSMIFGETNAGKTFNALHFALCVARGIKWFGRPVHQGEVLYIYSEGKLGLKPRLQAWRTHHQLPPCPAIRYIPFPVQLKEERQILFETIAQKEVKPRLVVIDNFSMCAIGTDQNAQDEVVQILAIAQELVDAYGCHVMVVHHTNKTGAFNGTQAFRNHVDTMIELLADDDHSLTMRCFKQREADHFSDIHLKLVPIEVGFDEEIQEPITSCVVIAAQSETHDQPSCPHIEQQMLDLLAVQGRMSYNAWKKECGDTGVIQSSAFSTHVGELLRKGLVAKEEMGKGKPTWYQALTSPSSSRTSPTFEVE